MQIGITQFIENFTHQKGGSWCQGSAEDIHRKFQTLNDALPARFLPEIRSETLNNANIILTEKAALHQLEQATQPPFVGLIEITDKPEEAVERIETLSTLDVIGVSLSSKSASELNVAPLLGAHAKSLFSASDRSLATMELAIQEATINALAHGNLGLKSAFEETGDNLNEYYSLIQKKAGEEDFKNKRIDIVLWENKSGVFAVIGDQGAGYKPPDRRTLSSRAKPLPDRRRLADRRQSGRGLDIIRQFARKCWISSPGTSVAMWFDK